MRLMSCESGGWHVLPIVSTAPCSSYSCLTLALQHVRLSALGSPTVPSMESNCTPHGKLFQVLQADHTGNNEALLKHLTVTLTMTMTHTMQRGNMLPAAVDELEVVEKAWNAVEWDHVASEAGRCWSVRMNAVSVTELLDAVVAAEEGTVDTDMSPVTIKIDHSAPFSGSGTHRCSGSSALDELNGCSCPCVAARVAVTMPRFLSNDCELFWVSAAYI
jgi:hypothetical protein